MIILKLKLLKILPAIFLVIAFITTFGFITELYGDTVKYECSICGYVYDPEGEGTPFEELPDDWTCPNHDCDGTKSDFFEVILVTWVCTYCSYVYDPVVEGVFFEELPDDWTCPGCNSLKSDFVKDVEYGEYISSDPWLAHLQHVLAMRSKHLAILQRVIDAHEAKNVEHISIYGLENAYVSSSKSVLKAKAEIDAYLEYLGSLIVTSDEQENEGNTESEEMILNSGDNEGQNTDFGNGKENNSNGNMDKKENKEHINNGKANGKNK